VKNELFLVVKYKFGVSIGGHSARGRPQAGRASYEKARAKGGWLGFVQSSKARLEDVRAGQYSQVVRSTPWGLCINISHFHTGLQY
jgi:hypothetical protein